MPGSKAGSYLTSLDDALCQRQWGAVPELVRKLVKHSPENAAFGSVAKNIAVVSAHVDSSKSDGLSLEGGPEDSTLQSAGNDLDSVGPQIQQHHSGKLVHAVSLAHVRLLQARYRDVIRVLSPIETTSSDQIKSRYGEVARTKMYAVLGMAYEQLGQSDTAIAIYDRLASSGAVNFDPVPDGLYWAELLYYRFGHLTTQTNYKEKEVPLRALRGYHNVSRSIAAVESSSPQLSATRSRRLATLGTYFTYLSTVLLENPSNFQFYKEAQNASILYEKILMESTNFPTADQSNTTMEQYVDLIMANWSSNVSRDQWDLSLLTDEGRRYTKSVLTSLRRALSVTFQSSSILRHIVILLIGLKDYDEAFAAFRTYLEYQQAHRVRVESGGASEAEHGDAIEGTLEVIARVILVNSRVTRNSDSAMEYAKVLQSWIPDQEKAGYQTVAQRKTLARAYGAVASAFFLNAKTTIDSGVYDSSIETAGEYFRLATGLQTNDVELQLEYSIYLTRVGNLALAVNSVRQGLFEDESHVQSWHMLALLMSAEENFDTALQIAESALGRRQFSQIRDNRTKEATMQLKLTQIALIEATNGAQKAIPELTEVLSTYYALFPHPEDSTAAAPQEENRGRKSISKEHRGIVDGVASLAVRRRSGSRGRQQQQKPKSRAQTFEDRVLKDIWLWISGVYRRAGLLQECDQAIVEAERVSGPSPDTHAETGILVMTDRPLRALEEFEAALDEDKSHLKSVLGLAQLVYSHSFETQDKDKKGLFTSKKDEAAANSRLMLLLSSVVRSAPGRFVPEAWWLLSQAYERADREDDVSGALWQSVALQERAAVRDYENVSGAIGSSGAAGV